MPTAVKFIRVRPADKGLFAIEKHQPVGNRVITPAEEPSELEGSVTTSEDDVAIVAQNDTPELIPTPADDGFAFADRTLPETAGHSGVELIAGLAMSAFGLAFVLASRSKFQA